MSLDSVEAPVVRRASGKTPTAGDGVARAKPATIGRATAHTARASSTAHPAAGTAPAAGELAASPGAGNPATASPAGPSVGQQLAASVAAWYARTPDEQDVHFEVRLEPPELGRIVVRMRKSRGRATARLLVSNDAARVAVQRELPALQQSLHEAGVKLDQFDLAQDRGDRGYERSEHGPPSAVRSVSRGEAGTSPLGPTPTDDFAAGHVDLRV